MKCFYFVFFYAIFYVDIYFNIWGITLSSKNSVWWSDICEESLLIESDGKVCIRFKVLPSLVSFCFNFLVCIV